MNVLFGFGKVKPENVSISFVDGSIMFTCKLGKTDDVYKSAGKISLGKAPKPSNGEWEVKGNDLILRFKSNSFSAMTFKTVLEYFKVMLE